jgi:hypothetical protein
MGYHQDEVLNNPEGEISSEEYRKGWKVAGF